MKSWKYHLSSFESGACACASCAEQAIHHGANAAISRRGFLRTATAGTVATVLAGAGVDLTVMQPARAQGTLTPEAALQEMMAGNRRFVAGRLTAFDADLSILKQKTVDKQEPFAAVLSCSDSRVPVEIAFDQSIGHLFVARVAGNVTTPEIIASLEYGALVLGTKVIMVLGHSNCGAVKATIDGKPVPGQISALYAPIRPAVDQAGSNLEDAIKANAKNQANLLSQASPVLAGLIQENKLKIVSAYYDLATGKVSLLG